MHDLRLEVCYKNLFIDDKPKFIEGKVGYCGSAD